MNREIIREAEKSLDVALSFYQDRVPLSYRPKLEYFDEEFRNYKALAREERISEKKCLDDFEKALEAVEWKEKYGLIVSEEALLEMDKAIVRFLLQDGIIEEIIPKKYSESDAHILIFGPYMDLDKRNQDGTMVHEVWHLIERERDVIEHTPFIIEGTAMYPQFKFMGLEPKQEIETFVDFQRMRYLGVLGVVWRHVNHKANPYLSILNPDVRTTIDDEVKGRVKGNMKVMKENILKNEEILNASSHICLKLPGYNELQDNPTKINLLRFYRNIGANKLADELEPQDTSLYLGETKSEF